MGGGTTSRVGQKVVLSSQLLVGESDCLGCVLDGICSPAVHGGNFPVSIRPTWSVFDFNCNDALASAPRSDLHKSQPFQYMPCNAILGHDATPLKTSVSFLLAVPCKRFR